MSFRKALLFLVMTLLLITVMVYFYFSSGGFTIEAVLIFIVLFVVIGMALLPILDWLNGAVQFIQNLFSKEKHRESAAKPYDLNDPQNKQNRKRVIANVRSGHIKGVLTHALHKQVRIELGLEYDPTASMRAMQLCEGQIVLRTISKKDEITDVFAEAGKELLILGAPGSGKTITLLELCDELLKQAEKKKKAPVPVVLNLSTWAEEKGALDRWIVVQMRKQYGLIEKVSQAWLAQSQLCLLLDGLDEVSNDLTVRDACIAAINEFKRVYTAPMVVCSRIKDYKVLSNQLDLSTAVVIQPLTDEQIKKYLTDKDLKLGAVYKAVKNDDALNELSRVPLNLNVIALAYGGDDEAQLKPLLKDVEKRRQHLYNAYIVRMFQRRPLRDVNYDQPTALHWLHYLAAQLTRREETQFFIENLRPSWLPKKWQRRQGRLNGLVFGLVFVLVVGLFAVLVVGLAFGLLVGLVSGLVLGLVKRDDYQVTDKVTWSGSSREVVFVGLFGGLFVGLVVNLFFGLFAVLVGGLAFGLLFGLFSGLVFSLESKQSVNRLRPNQGIKNSLRNYLFVGLVVGLVFGLVGGLVFGLVVGLVGGLVFGLFVGLDYGGGVAIRHYLLRLTLSRQRLLPLRLVPFLNNMTEHLLLQNAGAYFRFFHRSMQEHFAALTPKDIDRLVAEIKKKTP